jgi:hypothetical protein
MTHDLLFSERVYIALYARTGKWRAKRLPRHVVEIGIAERVKHKRGEPSMVEEMQWKDVAE